MATTSLKKEPLWKWFPKTIATTFLFAIVLFSISPETGNIRNSTIDPVPLLIVVLLIGVLFLAWEIGYWIKFNKYAGLNNVFSLGVVIMNAVLLILAIISWPPIRELSIMCLAIGVILVSLLDAIFGYIIGIATAKRDVHIPGGLDFDG